MARERIRHNNFSAGEFAPKLQSRSDIEAYDVGLARMTNFLTIVQGGAELRPGSWRLAASQNADAPDEDTLGRMIPFQRSTLESYTLELSAFKMRIWSSLDYRLVRDDSDVIVELATPWPAAVLRRLTIVQQADILIISDALNEYPNQIVSFRGDPAAPWRIDPYDFRNGPFKPSVPGLSITASGTTGSITLSTSAAYFDARHVGAIVWLKENPENITTKKWQIDKAVVLNDVREFAGRTYKALNAGTTGTAGPIHAEGRRNDGEVDWQFIHDGGAMVRITGFTSATVVTADVLTGQEIPAAAQSTPYWNMQAFNDLDGWPGCAGFHQERGWFGGTISQPDTIFSTRTNGYDDTGGDFQPSLGSGLVVDSDAVTRDLANGRVDPTAFVLSADDLFVGGASGSRKVRGPGNEEPITPAGAIARAAGVVGVQRGIAPVRIGDLLIFVELGGRRLIAMNFEKEETDLSLFSEHMFYGGVAEMQWEMTTKTLWLLTYTGELFAMVYHPKHNVQAFSPMKFDRKIESICVTRRADGFEHLWMLMHEIKKDETIQRDVCVMVRRWDFDIGIDDTCYLDMAGYFDATVEQGDVPDPTPTPEDPNPVDPPTTGPPSDPPLPVTGGGSSGGGGAFDENVEFIQKATDPDPNAPGELTRIAGLEYLEGHHVTVIADGQRIGKTHVVIDGRVDLNTSVTRGWVGIAYDGELRTLPPDRGLSGELGRNVDKQLDRLAVEYTGLGGKVDFACDFEDRPSDPILLPSRKKKDLMGIGVQPRRNFFDTEQKTDAEDSAADVHVCVMNVPGFPMQVHCIEYVVQANAG